MAIFHGHLTNSILISTFLANNCNCRGDAVPHCSAPRCWRANARLFGAVARRAARRDRLRLAARLRNFVLAKLERQRQQQRRRRRVLPLDCRVLNGSPRTFARTATLLG